MQLQQRDDDKVANEQAKNALESHIFETKDAMYSDAVSSVSTEDQREVIVNALNEASEWLEDEGYIADTKVRELVRLGGSVCNGVCVNFCARTRVTFKVLFLLEANQICILHAVPFVLQND